MITVIAILGMEHGGTTLLSRMLGTHSNAVSLGGIKNYAKFVDGKMACTCGQSCGDCTFWSKVEDALDAAGTSSRAVAAATKSRKEDRQAATSAAQHLLRAISAATGRNILVDSSRHPYWSNLLDDAPDIRTVRVHIFKTPFEQMASAKRKGRSRFKELLEYNRRSHFCRKAIRGHEAGITVPYGAFCGAPDLYLSRVMQAAGTEMEPAQISDWGATELHMLGGNRMKRETRSTIRYDERWRDALSSGEVLLARLVAGGALKRNIDSSSNG